MTNPIVQSRVIHRENDHYSLHDLQHGQTYLPLRHIPAQDDPEGPKFTYAAPARSAGGNSTAW